MPKNNGFAPARISVTRALKNARYLQRVAPEVMPKVEPAAGFGSIIPLKVLAKLHRADGLAASDLDAKLRKQLQEVSFPKVSNTSGDPLFKGTLYFVRINFTVQSQGNAVQAVSAADTAVAIQYAVAAAPAISSYARQYGANSLAVSQTIIGLNVVLPGPSYNDSQLQGWVNQVAGTLPVNACVVVLNPEGMTNTSGDRAAGIGGYHGRANVPYIFVNLFGANLTVADEAFAYAQILSHEMAEMVVDPLVDGKNPEVCDGCGPNCQAVFLSYFGDNGYLQTTQAWPPTFAYKFYINAIVRLASASACPAPAAACDYGPPPQFFPWPIIAHVHDAAWLIQLWLAIHGGDPAPGELPVAQQVVGNLATIRAVTALVRCLEDASVEREVAAALKPVSERLTRELGEELTQY